jgi:hypothetical protein
MGKSEPPSGKWLDPLPPVPASEQYALEESDLLAVSASGERQDKTGFT